MSSDNIKASSGASDKAFKGDIALQNKVQMLPTVNFISDLAIKLPAAVHYHDTSIHSAHLSFYTILFDQK